MIAFLWISTLLIVYLINLVSYIFTHFLISTTGTEYNSDILSSINENMGTEKNIYGILCIKRY